MRWKHAQGWGTIDTPGLQQKYRYGIIDAPLAWQDIAQPMFGDIGSLPVKCEQCGCERQENELVERLIVEGGKLLVKRVCWWCPVASNAIDHIAQQPQTSNQERVALGLLRFGIGIYAGKQIWNLLFSPR